MNISVIIPVYNAELFLRKAVESALQFKEVKEVLLIEDGSPDNALSICKELTIEDNRVKLLQHPNNENRGAGASRNLGLKNASQDYIAFLDADDFFLPNRFEKDKEIFSRYEDADGVYNAIGVHYYSDKGKEIFRKSFNVENDNVFLTTIQKEIDPAYLFDVLVNYKREDLGYFHLDGLTLKRLALKKVKMGAFDESLRLHQDTEFLWRLAYYTKLYPSNISEATAKRGVHNENRITANGEDVLKKLNNRFKMFSISYQWGKSENINPQVLQFFKSQMVYSDVYKQAGIKMIFVYLKHIFITKGFLTNEAFHKTRSDMKQIIKNKLSSLKK